jgi:hypothetical protein
MKEEGRIAQQCMRRKNITTLHYTTTQKEKINCYIAM